VKAQVGGGSAVREPVVVVGQWQAGGTGAAGEGRVGGRWVAGADGAMAASDFDA
jgi:hypothetical protein